MGQKLSPLFQGMARERVAPGILVVRLREVCLDPRPRDPVTRVEARHADPVRVDKLSARGAISSSGLLRSCRVVARTQPLLSTPVDIGRWRYPQRAHRAATRRSSRDGADRPPVSLHVQTDHLPVCHDG
jgi:hypothetical protein